MNGKGWCPARTANCEREVVAKGITWQKYFRALDNSADGVACHKIIWGSCRNGNRGVGVALVWGVQGPCGIRQRSGKSRGIVDREIPVSIIYEYSDRRFQPSRADDKIDDIVAVDIARGDFQSANRPGDADHLRRACTHPEANPIARVRHADQCGFNCGEVGAIVAVKVGNREVRCSSGVCERDNLRRIQAGAASAETEDGTEQQKDNPLARLNRSGAGGRS